MPGSRTYEDVTSYAYAADASGFDDSGYVFAVDSNDRLTKATDSHADTDIFGVNYVSTEDQDGVVQSVSDDDELDTVRHSAGMELRCDDEDYSLGDPVYVSTSNDGHVNQSNTSNAYVGKVVEAVDHSGESGNNQHVLVAFSFDQE